MMDAGRQEGRGYFMESIIRENKEGKNKILYNI